MVGVAAGGDRSGSVELNGARQRNSVRGNSGGSDSGGDRDRRGRFRGMKLEPHFGVFQFLVLQRSGVFRGRQYQGPCWTEVRKLLVYGVIGPRADLDAFGEIDVISPNPDLADLRAASRPTRVSSCKYSTTPWRIRTSRLVIQFRRLIAEGGLGSNGRIVGVVRDAITHFPLPNSVVAVYRDGDLIDSLLTDTEGQFQVAAIPGAVYRFRSPGRATCR